MFNVGNNSITIILLNECNNNNNNKSNLYSAGIRHVVKTHLLIVYDIYNIALKLRTRVKAGLELLFNRGKTKALPARTRIRFSIKVDNAVYHARGVQYKPIADQTDVAALNGHLIYLPATRPLVATGLFSIDKILASTLLATANSIVRPFCFVEIERSRESHRVEAASSTGGESVDGGALVALSFVVGALSPYCRHMFIPCYVCFMCFIPCCVWSMRFIPCYICSMCFIPDYICSMCFFLVTFVLNVYSLLHLY